MSLNGLDVPEVQDAWQSAIADPGGWFLLKYISRDAVELHGRGRGGVAEARAAIANYTEASPLYGLLIYRRRRVLIKYIPAGTSRVLQARTAVHFQDVTERYAPYDTLLEIATAEGLSDTSLAASFPLHTASMSISSSKLQEISEDAEDPGNAPRRPPVQTQSSGGIFGSRKREQTARVPRTLQASAESPSSALTPGKNSISSQILVREDSGKRSITTIGGSPLGSSVTSYDTAPSEISAATRSESDSKSSLTSDAKAPLRPSASLKRPGTQGSSNTATGIEPLLEESSLSVSPPASSGSDIKSYSDRMKEALEEPFDFSYLEKKQKVKLAPRPVPAKRAATTGVSALPAHYRPQTKKAETTPTPVVQTYANPFPILPVPPIPVSQAYDPRPVSRGSVKSLPSHKSTTMTPDKIRLMKAVELRKRQLRKSNPALPSVIPGVDPNAPDVPSLPESIPEQPKQEAKEARLDELRNADNSDNSAKKADSGIEMDYQKTEQPVDAPVSPLVEQPEEPAIEDPVARDSTNDKPTAEEPITEERTVEEPAQEKAATEITTQPAEVSDTTTSTTSEAHIPAATTIAQEQVPEEVTQDIEDPAVIEALRNDELRAEAEGYGAVPAEISEAEQPSLHKFGSPRNELSPTSQTSQSENLPEAVLNPIQDASKALVQSTDVPVPRIVMSPGSPVAQTYSPSGMPPSLLKQTENAVEAEDENIEVPTSPRRQNSDLAKRRRGVVEPLHLDTQAELLSDDELMDELQSATVQEARPMAVAKSPVNAYFSRRPSNQSLVSAQSQHSDRSASARVITANREKAAEELESTNTLAEPIQFTRRSLSSMESKDAFAGLRKNVGTGIAKRFAALTESKGDGAPSTPGTASPARSVELSPSSKRKSNHRSRTGSFKGRWGIGDRASSSSTVASTSENGPTWSISQDGNNRDSISVRARIVRPPSGLDTHLEAVDAKPAAATLQSSQLEINHSVGPNSSPLNTATSALTSIESRSSMQSPRRRKESVNTLATQAEDFPLPPSVKQAAPSIISHDDASTSNGTSGSRTSRFFKRMSSLGTSSKRRSIAQQSAMTIDSAASADSSRTITEKDKSDMPPAAALGDLNVQFPDTLLWKRRWITLDDSGNLILGIPQNLEHSRGLVPKKHHLLEFKPPYIPDLDRQEIPHSICLDFTEGGTLQVACEDAMGQRQVLSMLRNYHKSWTS